jgi:hypothetical protein
MKSSWTWTGLATMVALMGGPNFAMGGPTMSVPSTGIIITHGAVAPVGDPSFAYTFDIQLAAGSILLDGGLITVYDLPDITGSSLTSQPNHFWSESLQETGITPLNPNPVPTDTSLENVTWFYSGATIDNSGGSSPLDLGNFSIGPIPENEPSVTLTYVGSLDGVNAADTGTVTVTAIPEPSSLILLLTAMVGAPLLVLRTRQCRRVAV